MDHKFSVSIRDILVLGIFVSVVIVAVRLMSIDDILKDVINAMSQVAKGG